MLELCPPPPGLEIAPLPPFFSDAVSGSVTICLGTTVVQQAFSTMWLCHRPVLGPVLGPLVQAPACLAPYTVSLTSGLPTSSLHGLWAILLQQNSTLPLGDTITSVSGHVRGRGQAGSAAELK